MNMTTQQAETILRASFPDCEQDDLETYLFGPDDADAYFATFASEAELNRDFEQFLEAGK